MTQGQAPFAATATGHQDIAPGSVLGPRALNRALLARQLLLGRVEMSIPDAISHLVGLQAQASRPPYIGLWTRLAGFEAGDLSRLIVERRVVRVSLMRVTIHLVTAAGGLALRPLLQPLFARALNSIAGRPDPDWDIQAIAVAGRALVETRPRTLLELGGLLAERWAGGDPIKLANVVRYSVPLVQVPPRGLWEGGGPATWTTLEAWLGRPLEPNPSLDEMAVRYLTAFGPATVSDIAAWSGLTRWRNVVDRLRPRLVTFRDEHGRELFDVPGAPLPHPETPVPPRLLAEFDNILLSHADRTRIIADADRKRVISVNGLVAGTALIDGFVGGTWKMERRGRAATLRIEPFISLSAKVTAALTAEGAQLLAFAAGDAASHDIQFTLPR
jgi:hypothetical protein